MSRQRLDGAMRAIKLNEQGLVTLNLHCKMEAEELKKMSENYESENTANNFLIVKRFFLYAR